MERSEGSGEMIPDFLYRADDDPISPASVREDEFGGSYVPDALDKVLADAKRAAATNLGRSAHQHIHNFDAEAAERNNAVAAHYKKLALAATTKNPATPGDDDPHRLEKRTRRVVVYGDANDA